MFDMSYYRVFFSTKHLLFEKGTELINLCDPFFEGFIVTRFRGHRGLTYVFCFLSQAFYIFLNSNIEYFQPEESRYLSVDRVVRCAPLVRGIDDRAADSGLFESEAIVS